MKTFIDTFRYDEDPKWRDTKGYMWSDWLYNKYCELNNKDCRTKEEDEQIDMIYSASFKGRDELNKVEETLKSQSSNNRIDITFDFTKDTKNYWNNWWTKDNGDEIVGTRKVTDPDAQSKTLCHYHKLLWSKPLPNGELFDLQEKRDSSYFLQWDNHNSITDYSSDSLVNSFRWDRPSMKNILIEMKKFVEEELHQNYQKWLEDYVRKAYTIGGMIIHPRKNVKESINIARARSPLHDRVDYYVECVRRHYSGQESSISKVLDANKTFFDLFIDFKGYVDFFFLQDLVSEDYKFVKSFIGNPDFSGYTLPQTKEDYLKWHDKTIEFVEKRNIRINKWVIKNL